MELTKEFQAHEEVLKWLLTNARNALDSTKGGYMAGVGVIILFWSVISLLNQIETSFNHIWQVSESRPWYRKFTDYLTIMLLAPVLLILSSSITVFASTTLNEFMEKAPILEFFKPIVSFLIKFAPFLLVWIMLTLLFIVMPNEKVKFMPALVSGIIAGTALKILQWLYLDLQFGITKLSAIYGTLAAIPLFIILLQTSWLIILIGAELSFITGKGSAMRGSVPVILHGGTGVGLVTRPGLPVRKGSPAINPVPRAMIRRAIREAIAEAADKPRVLKAVEVTILVPDGEALAKKTFNPRLGILGGISILGTTGIVKPFSHQAYKETVALALNIARASGCREVVLSTGGQSERLAMARFSPLRGESFIQMGDYVGFSLKQALNRGFRRITVAAFMGKLAKIAAGASNTHAGNVPLEMSFVAALGQRLRLNADLLRAIERSVTMRGVLELVLRRKAYALIDAVCRRAMVELYRMAGDKGSISVLLFSFDGRVLWHGGKEGKREGIG